MPTVLTSIGGFVLGFSWSYMTTDAWVFGFLFIILTQAMVWAVQDAAHTIAKDAPR